MAVTGLYHTLDEAQLLKMRDDVLAQLSLARQGKRLNAVGGGGKSFSRQLMSVDELQQELVEITASLQRVNPAKYGRRVRTMRVSFSGGTGN